METSAFWAIKIGFSLSVTSTFVVKPFSVNAFFAGIYNSSVSLSNSNPINFAIACAKSVFSTRPVILDGPNEYKNTSSPVWPPVV